MKLRSCFAAIALCAILVSTTWADSVEVGPDSVELTVQKQAGPNLKINTFLVTFLGYEQENGATKFSYKVEEVGQGDPDLSHWNLGLAECLKPITVIPDQELFGKSEHGTDGSTGFFGLKYDDVPDGFDDGIFMFTVEGDWVMGTIDVLVKGGDTYDVGQIKGPVCGVCEVPSPAALPAGAMLLGGIVMYHFRRRRQAA